MIYFRMLRGIIMKWRNSPESRYKVIQVVRAQLHKLIDKHIK